MSETSNQTSNARSLRCVLRSALHTQEWVSVENASVGFSEVEKCSRILPYLERQERKRRLEPFGAGLKKNWLERRDEAMDAKRSPPFSLLTRRALRIPIRPRAKDTMLERRYRVSSVTLLWIRMASLMLSASLPQRSQIEMAPFTCSLRRMSATRKLRRYWLTEDTRERTLRAPLKRPFEPRWKL